MIIYNSHSPKINFQCPPPPPHLAAAQGGTMRDMTLDRTLSASDGQIVRIILLFLSISG